MCNEYVPMLLSLTFFIKFNDYEPLEEKETLYDWCKNSGIVPYVIEFDDESFPSTSKRMTMRNFKTTRST